MELCLGTVQFGLKYGIAGADKPERTDCFKIMDCALDNGINVFDTARVYGDSEEVLGEYFKGKDRNSFKVATKLMSNGDCEKEIAYSLNSLGLDYVDFYLFHKGDMINDENAVKQMYKLKEKGLTKRIGVSVYTPNEALKAVNNPLIDCVQIPYNVFDKRLDDLGFFELAEKADKTVFCRSIFLQGLVFLTPEDGEKKLVGSGKVLGNFNRLCAKYGLSALEFATSYIKQKKKIDYCIFGVDNLKQLKEQLELNKIRLPNQAVIEADEIFKDVEERILDPRQWNK